MGRPKPTCGFTGSHDCLGPNTNPNGNHQCTNADKLNAARPKGFDALPQDLFEYIRDNRKDLKSWLPERGNKLSRKPLFKHLIQTGEIVPIGDYNADLAKWAGVKFDKDDADLDAVIAEAEKAEAEAAATPGFNENPTLVQFVQKQVADVKRRAGQERWKRELRREDGQACVVSRVKEALEASHLNYPGKPLSLRGVTLRMDLAHLFDYKGAKLTTREDGTIFWDYPGHEFHGRVLNLTLEKAKAVAAELATHRPQIEKVAA